MLRKTQLQQAKKKIRVRKKIWGTAERPRMNIFRSLNQIYVQFIDDNAGKTLFSVSSISKEIADEVKKAKTKTEKSKIVGSLAAKKAVESGIKSAIFDRNIYRYHGRVKAVADGAREGGLKI
ncbi:MAG: 50S ribosomal protein L18 [Ignavibacteriales bacterium]|jgi:large subunit ribosomal protein L18|nr:MAG: 50S ribosomal protein L18 [Ignavibacteriales bacterium]